MIIFDLDGTLADCEHRRHFVEKGHPNNLRGLYFNDKDSLKINENGTFEVLNRLDRPNWKPDWKAFYEACDKDEPIKPTIDIFRTLYLQMQHTQLQIWSARCESVRKKTLMWLDFHINPRYDFFDIIKMRPIGDYTPDEVLKERWLDVIVRENRTVDFVFDNKTKVIDMYRKRGIFVFDVNQTGKEF